MYDTTEYQKGKYKSLVKEISELEKRAARQNNKWLFKTLVLIVVLSTASDVIIDKISTGTIRDWSRYVGLQPLIGRTLFWGTAGYFLFVRGIRSELKRKKFELAELLQKAPDLRKQTDVI